MESSKDLPNTDVWKQFSAIEKNYRIMEDLGKDEGVEVGKEERGYDDARALDGFWSDIMEIKQNLGRISEEIDIVKTIQEIKNVKTERVELVSKIFEAKLRKFEERVWENDEKVKEVDRKLEKIEKVLGGFSDFDRKICVLEVKHAEIEKAAYLYSKHRQQFF